ncbi:MAG TPA: cytochrome c biogenesis protein CcsA [Gemmataceae bacterium]|jgi:ABC-type transport system involved in cytochrome c biogenesis permease subunit
MKDFAKVFPWLVVGAAGLYLIFSMMPPGTAPGKMSLEEFGSIPVVDRGRVKPLDTVARTTLMIISNRQIYKDENDKEQPAIKWLLEVMTRPDEANRLKVFRIENDQVLSLLGLEARPGSYRYAVEEFAGKIEVIRDQAIAAQNIKPDRRDIFQDKIIEFAKHLELYSELGRLESPLMVPPQEKGGDWQSLLQALVEFRQLGARNSAAESLVTALHSYSHNEPKKFNQALAEYHKQTDAQFPSEAGRTDFEMFFNHFEPFYQCTLLYVAVFLLSCLSWFGWTEPLNRAAFRLAVLTLVVHTGALIARMYLMDRWFVFVTNLYSSAVFIGWGCVVLGLILEKLYHNGVGNVVASVLGALTMLVAHHLGGSGDTLEMMQAVLDTNFWLATHVTCVTLGYTATFVAGALGIVYLIRGVLTPSLDRSTAKALTSMLYAVVCFATLLSFTGTVLGGIWADQSWGRFWGWDPKENGAMLIVIWNALILHARWGGMVQSRGMAVLAVVGNMVTGWSWFGTNQLQVGLHSYGFSNTLAVGLVAGWLLHAAVLVLGLLPLRWWASYNALTAAKLPAVEEDARRPAPSIPKSRGKRGSRRGDPSYFPGSA